MDARRLCSVYLFCAVYFLLTASVATAITFSDFLTLNNVGGNSEAFGIDDSLQPESVSVALPGVLATTMTVWLLEPGTFTISDVVTATPNPGMNETVLSLTSDDESPLPGSPPDSCSTLPNLTCIVETQSGVIDVTAALGVTTLVGNAGSVLAISFPTEVPEPGSFILLGAGFVGLIAMGGHRHRVKAHG